MDNNLIEMFSEEITSITANAISSFGGAYMTIKNLKQRNTIFRSI